MWIKQFKKHICIAGITVVLFGALGLTNAYANSYESVKINATNFPDAKFREYVLEELY